MEQIDLFESLGYDTAIESKEWRWEYKDYPKKNGLKVFSCFACGGGSTMGYKLAGCEVIGDLEIDPKMNSVYVANHHPKYNFVMDIREFNEMDVPEELYDLDVLDGSPPCTTFSIAGDREESWGVKKKFREGQKEQTLDDLSFVFIDTARKLKPKTIIMENVEGLLLGEAWSYVQKIYAKLDEIGYNVKHWLLKGEKMGVPQTRHRVFFVAVRKDLNFNLDKVDMYFNYKPVLFGEIKEGVGKPASKMAKTLMNEMKENENIMADAHTRLFGKRGWFNMTAFNDEKIGFSIVAGHGALFRRKEQTLLSWQDIRNAQTFPRDYDFCGQDPSYICGMSVPPLMMKRVITRLIESGLYDYKIKE